MSLPQFTTQQIADNIIAQLESSLSTSFPLLPKSFTRVLAKTLSAVVVLLYKYAGFIFLQLFVEYATIKEVQINGRFVRPLVSWGRLIGVDDPEPASRAEIELSVSAPGFDGSTLAAGAQLVHLDSGVLYQTIAPLVLSGPSLTVLVRANQDSAGPVGNRVVGEQLDWVTPSQLIERASTVTGVALAGEDAESEDSYRARVITRFQKRPQGGAYADYEMWAEEVDGIIHAYPYTSDTPGVIEIFCEASPETAIDADGTPSNPMLGEVVLSINRDIAGRATRRPINDGIYVQAITRKTLNVTVYGLAQVDDVTATQDQITAALGEYMAELEPWIEGLSVRPVRNRAETASIAGICSEVARSRGGYIVSVGMDDGVNLSLYTLGMGEKAKLGTVTFAAST